MDADATRRAIKQWDQAGPAWARWSSVIDEWLEPVTSALQSDAHIEPGQTVVDVACGAGEPSLTLARQVGERGHVYAVDASRELLGTAAQRAVAAGLQNVTTVLADGQTLERIPDSTADAAVSRLGTIYFPDRRAAMTAMRRVLKTGGRVAIAGITDPPANRFSALTMRALFQALPAPPSPPPKEAPGPFSLSDPEVMGELLTETGFTEISIRIVDCDLHMDSAQACADMQREAFAGLDSVLATLESDDRDRAWASVAEALAVLETPDGFLSPTRFIVGAGVAA